MKNQYVTDVTVSQKDAEINKKEITFAENGRIEIQIGDFLIRLID